MAKEREAREPIYELEKKIRFLLKRLHKSVNSLHQKDRVSRSALRDVMEKHLDEMSRPVQTQLAKACHFGVDWEEWNDPHSNQKTPREKRRDTAERFEQRYLHENPSRARGQPAAPRRTGERLKVTRPYAAQAFDPHLASIELQASQSGPGEPWPVSVDLIFQPAPVECFMIAVKCGRLVIDCGQARTTDLKDRVGYPDGADHSREACKIILWPGGNSQRPEWCVVADPGPIGLLSLPYDFCPIHDLSAGDIIAASFSAYIKDLDLVEPPEPHDGEEAPPRQDSISFMSPGFKNLGRAKQMILKRLAETKLPEGPPGWVQLCSDALQFKEIGTDGDKDG